jgi:hypothetical protein
MLIAAGAACACDGRWHEVARCRTRWPHDARRRPTQSQLPIAVALFGAAALWAVEPALASALGVPRETGSTGSDSDGACGELRRVRRLRMSARRRHGRYPQSPHESA